MKKIEHIMGMPVIVQLPKRDEVLFARIFDYFRSVDQRFSPYIATSEVSLINRNKDTATISKDMQQILALANQTKSQTNGYFDVWHNGIFDPSGVVKGWAIQKAADIAKQAGTDNFYIEAGGDIMTSGYNEKGQPWRIGIRNPFDRRQTVKILELSGSGIATSGTAIRGQHIYDPHHPGKTIDDIASLTVVGPSVEAADRFATAAFAMGREGIQFINQLDGFEGYMIDTHGIATMTNDFERYIR